MRMPPRAPRITILAVVLAMVGVPASSAMAGPVVRAGVEPARLAPPGMQLSRVSVPARPGLPVRLVFTGDAGARVLVDVTVAASANEAQAALARWRAHLGVDAVAVPDLGDVAYAAGGSIGLARDNVAVVVHALDDPSQPKSRGVDLDAGRARQLADRADAAIAAAPRGNPRAAPLKVAVPELPEGRPVRVEPAPGMLAARLEVGGPATVRRDKTAFWLTRTGAGDVSIRVVAVDPGLRVSW